VGRNVAAYLYLLPALILFAAFAWYPVISGFIISFQKVDLINPPQWVGLENFRTLFNDPLFYQAWKNTLQYTALGLVFGFLVPVFLAVAVNEMRHGMSYFRLAFYLPAILPPIVSALLWGWFYDPGTGLFNQILSSLGLPTLQWLQSPSTAMLSIVLITTWAGAGGAMLIYLAALQGIPAQLYEAAELDGAGLWQRVLHITLPQLRFVMLIMLVLQIIGTMQLFTEPFALTSGGPANATLSVVLLIYRYAFNFGDYGMAAAASLVLFLVLVAFSLVYLWLTRRFSK
jgi:multiple sugar transport system permease protein